MSTIDHPEPNTTVARLHLSLDGDYNHSKPDTKKTEAIREIEKRIENTDSMPTGATIIKGTGIWMPRNENGRLDTEKREVEPNLVMEFWIDSPEELSEIRSFKEHLENRFDQYCVCLSLEDRYYEH